jgi:hypothetical protein
MKSFGQKKMVRKMSYISDQEGIMNRYLREQNNWESHLQNTKHFILNAFAGKEIKTLAVLGSGWLLDLPLDELSAKYTNILLVDVHHPPQIIKKTESYSNVTLFETDLSGGGIEFCWDLRKAKDEHFSKYILDDFKPHQPELPFKPDAFVSLNLLNQLDILLIEFLKRKSVRIVDTEIKKFRKTIQQFHLKWITKKPGCLITDIRELNNGEEEQTEQKLVYVDLPKPTRSEEWIWDFDLSKTYRTGMETRMKVRAVEW